MVSSRTWSRISHISWNWESRPDVLSSQQPLAAVLSDLVRFPNNASRLSPPILTESCIRLRLHCLQTTAYQRLAGSKTTQSLHHKSYSRVDFSLGAMVSRKLGSHDHRMPCIAGVQNPKEQTVTSYLQHKRSRRRMP